MIKEFSCKFCSRVFTNKGIGGHTKMCSLNPEREKNVRSLELARQSITQASLKKMGESLKKKWSQGSYDEAIKKRTGVSRKKLSDTSRQNIAKGRRKWLAENPEKHQWRLKTDRYYSHPCEKFKDSLRCKSIEFVEEYRPFVDRHFSIDIAFPTIRVGIEINGGQHYGEGGVLKEYYQRRHEAIESAGWKLYEIPHRACYSEIKINEIINSITDSYDLTNVDWSSFIPQKTKRQKRLESEASQAERNQQLEAALTVRKNENLTKWREAISRVDTTKFGFIGKLAGMMDCSHTHVRRVLQNDFPELETFKRKSSAIIKE